MVMRESISRWVGWMEDWMVKAAEMESRRRRRAPTWDLFPPGQKEQILAVTSWSLRPRDGQPSQGSGGDGGLAAGVAVQSPPRNDGVQEPPEAGVACFSHNLQSR
jgi:hypothetical protein